MSPLLRSSEFLLLFLVAGLVPPAAQSQSNDDCLMCHSDPSQSMVKAGKQVSLFVDRAAFERSAHKDFECVACHVGFDPTALPHARKIKPVDCTSCHGERQFVQYHESVHGAPRKGGGVAATCADCHSPHSIIPLGNADQANRRKFDVETCARCHDAVYARYMTSDHGLAVRAGVKGAPTCIDCHGEHEVASPTSEQAQTSHRREAEMCLKCHLDDPEVRAKVGLSAGFVSSYENSVHAQAIKSGNDLAASCSDCHGSHEMKKGSNPASKVSRLNIVTTCGRCHGEIESEYERSIHGKALAAGVMASATCTDCHGEHNILAHDNAASPVSAKNVSAKVCAPCHSSVRLTQKYGLAGDRFQSFEDSYHGLATAAGSVEVANCASCHGVHDITPSSDPASRINKANLAKTCGKCHPGANENFTRGSVHVIATSGSEEPLYIIATAYIVLIVVTIGGMLFHNILDFVKKATHHLLVRRGAVPPPLAGHRLYLRMTLNERIQHAALLTSFIVLVVTGFALRFPEAWWVEAVRSISPLMFGLRGILHRVAAVVMVLASLYHVYYVLVVPRGKRLIRDLLPVRQDLTEAAGVMKYNLGLSRVKPRLGRFSYVEKAEYWALIWGTAIMTVTGIILWFENTFLGLLTKLGWDIARTVHYYEAWLATLAIIVWHFYFVIFNPDSYPINLAFLKGTLTEREMEDEHPRELEEVKRREALQADHEETEA